MRTADHSWWLRVLDVDVHGAVGRLKKKIKNIKIKQPLDIVTFCPTGLTAVKVTLW